MILISFWIEIEINSIHWKKVKCENQEKHVLEINPRKLQWHFIVNFKFFMHYAFFALIMPGEAQRGLGNFRISKLIKNHVTVFSIIVFYNTETKMLLDISIQNETKQYFQVALTIMRHLRQWGIFNLLVQCLQGCCYLLTVPKDWNINRHNSPWKVWSIDNIQYFLENSAIGGHNVSIIWRLPCLAIGGYDAHYQ